MIPEDCSHSMRLLRENLINVDHQGEMPVTCMPDTEGFMNTYIKRDKAVQAAGNVMCGKASDTEVMLKYEGETLIYKSDWKEVAINKEWSQVSDPLLYKDK